MPELTADPIRLHSDRLTVEIASPGTLYQGTRFDWTAFITQVTLDNQHTLCVPESYEPGSWGPQAAGTLLDDGAEWLVQCRPSDGAPR